MSGRHVAYGLSPAGSEASTAHVMGVESGKILETRIPNTDFGITGWLPDGSGFLYIHFIGERGTPTFYWDSVVTIFELRRLKRSSTAAYSSLRCACGAAKRGQEKPLSGTRGSPLSGLSQRILAAGGRQAHRHTSDQARDLDLEDSAMTANHPMQQATSKRALARFFAAADRSRQSSYDLPPK